VNITAGAINAAMGTLVKVEVASRLKMEQILYCAWLGHARLGQVEIGSPMMEYGSSCKIRYSSRTWESCGVVVSSGIFRSWLKVGIYVLSVDKY
jgi:hypothetical protein